MKISQRTQKFLIRVPAVIVAVGLLLLAFSWLLDKREEYAFQKIALHAPESIVIALMGAPLKITACGEDLWWGENHLGKNDGSCVQEERYEHMHDAWAVGYAKDKHVVSKRHYIPQKD
jgi:hypothetical protein